MNSYSGIDNLEAVKAAHNYNRFLINQVTRASKGAQTALDFGAGLGTFSDSLRERGIVVETVETDPTLQARLQVNGYKVLSRLEDYADSSFNFICTLNVLEHVEDDSAVFRQFHRVLKPGGRVYIYVPAFDLLWSSMDDKVGHLRRYRKQDLADQLAQVGFTIESARYRDTVGFFATLAYQLFGSRRGDLDSRSLSIFDRFLFPMNRILDVICGSFLGKNVEVIACRQA